jgi:hypothetical protein
MHFTIILVETIDFIRESYNKISYEEGIAKTDVRRRGRPKK